MLTGMQQTNLVTGQDLKTEFPFLSDLLFFRLRKERKIPFIKLGHRTFLYNPMRVQAALEKLEIKEVA
jgi:hypothetical protein